LASLFDVSFPLRRIERSIDRTIDRSIDRATTQEKHPASSALLCYILFFADQARGVFSAQQGLGAGNGYRGRSVGATAARIGSAPVQKHLYDPQTLWHS
jgi:hypothetical protein